MTQLLDPVGATIPSDYAGRPLFDADLCDWSDGRGPIITLNVPMYFETPGGAYDGSGVIVASVKDVLEEYLLDFEEIDGGDSVESFAAWLHDYADKLKKAANVLANRRAALTLAKLKPRLGPSG